LSKIETNRLIIIKLVNEYRNCFKKVSFLDDLGISFCGINTVENHAPERFQKDKAI